MFKFSAKAVHLCSHYMAQSDIRCYLNGIYAEPAPGGGAFLVATDGHQMGVYYDADAVCLEPVIFSITKAGIAACKPARRRYDGHVLINSQTWRLTVQAKRDDIPGAASEELYLQPGKCQVEGKFPDWKRVMKPFMTGEACEKVTVNAAYLARFHTAVKAHCERYGFATSIFFKSESDAILLTNDSNPEFQVIVMPMRHSNPPRMHEKLRDCLKNYEPEK